MRVVVAFVMVLLVAGSARAQEPQRLVIPSTVFIAAQVLDLHSTHLARSGGAGREANPFMNVSTSKQVAIKAAASAGVIALTHIIGRHHPAIAKTVLYGCAGAVTVVAARNYRIAGGAR